MIRSGLQVTIVSNVYAPPIEGAYVETLSTILRLSAETPKMPLLLSTGRTKSKLRRLVEFHDIVYVSGKMLYLVPWLKKTNSSLKIVVHLHDYQFICPHSSLYNTLHRGTCENIWSAPDCTRCTQKLFWLQNRSLTNSVLNAAVSLSWREINNIPRVLRETDLFIVVSNRQLELIVENLGKYSQEFRRKTKVLYNPVDGNISYVPPSLGKIVNLAYFGGTTYIKGYEEIVRTVQNLKDPSVRLLVTRSQRGEGSSRIQFLGDLDRAERQKVLQTIWALVLPSIWEETSSYAAVEVQLQGRPVIATQLGGVRENIVEQGFTGSLVDPTEHQQFEEIIQYYKAKLIENPLAYTKRISEMSQKFFSDRTSKSYQSFLDIVA